MRSQVAEDPSDYWSKEGNMPIAPSGCGDLDSSEGDSSSHALMHELQQAKVNTQSSAHTMYMNGLKKRHSSFVQLHWRIEYVWNPFFHKIILSGGSWIPQGNFESRALRKEAHRGEAWLLAGMIGFRDDVNDIIKPNAFFPFILHRAEPMYTRMRSLGTFYPLYSQIPLSGITNHCW